MASTKVIFPALLFICIPGFILLSRNSHMQELQDQRKGTKVESQLLEVQPVQNDTQAQNKEVHSNEREKPNVQEYSLPAPKALYVRPDKNAPRSIQHNGTKIEMPVSGEVAKALEIVRARSIDRPSRAIALNATYVTAFNAGHFEESREGIGSLHLRYPGRKIIFYDLGLTKGQVKEIKTWCNVEYRVFNYSSYPKHIRNLMNYSWKILVILDVLKETNAVVWLDTSIRYECNQAHELLSITLGNSGIALPLTGFPSPVCYTHPGIYNYLATDLTLLSESPMYGGGFLAFINTKEIFDNIFEWLVRCAFTEQCMAASPKQHCPEPDNYMTHWVGCHRYDQSAINILITHHFKGDFGKYTSWVCNSVKRGGGSTYSKHIKACKK